ncbi:MAG: hypothetical protein ACJ72V_15645 [Nitrososphaeraceae archaeon]
MSLYILQISSSLMRKFLAILSALIAGGLGITLVSSASEAHALIAAN